MDVRKVAIIPAKTNDGCQSRENTMNSTEMEIAKIWANVLEIDHVGVHDNFLLLGGESLLATQAAALIREAFGREVSMRSILVGTVAEVAAELATAV